MMWKLVVLGVALGAALAPPARSQFFNSMLSALPVPAGAPATSQFPVNGLLFPGFVTEFNGSSQYATPGGFVNE